MVEVGLYDPIEDAGHFYDDLYDHIDDLIDFPGDHVLGMEMSKEMDINITFQGGGTPTLAPASKEMDNNITIQGGGMPAPASDDRLDLSAFPSLPLHVDLLSASSFPSLDGLLFQDDQKLPNWDELDLVHLEWMSNFLYESNSSFDNYHIPEPGGGAVDIQSPKSVLLQTSLGSGGAAFPSSPTSSSSSPTSSGDGSSSSDLINSDCHLFTRPVHSRPRSKRLRPRATISSVPLASARKKSRPPLQQHFPILDGDEEEQGSSSPVRKCAHCQITKTPQWRAGPLGPKTLCNACGVRYKSGRLFPEYRPAASPTFVSSLHSNSHKKVVEMRLKETETPTADLLEFLRRRE